MFKFLHAADIHLDSPLKGLSRYQGMPADEIRLASRHAFERLITLAIEEAVQFVLIAGDLYDGDWKDSSTGLFFNSCMTRLRLRNIPVYLIKGNHDAASIISKSLPTPANVHVFDSKRAHSLIVPNAEAIIHGHSFGERHVKENIAADYPPRDPARFNIGMLHTSLTGSAEHDTYAPCSIDDLRSKGYDYWALGHIHAAQEVSTNPWIVFPGNIQGRSIRETGAKGCRIVTVDDAHRVESCDFHPLDLFRWQHVEIDLSSALTPEALHQTFDDSMRVIAEQDEVSHILRITLSGETPLAAYVHSHTGLRDDLRTIATDAGAEKIWLEKIELHCHTPRRTRSIEGPLAEVTAALENLNATEVAILFAPLKQKLHDKAALETMLTPATPDYQQLLAEVEALLNDRLSGKVLADAD